MSSLPNPTDNWQEIWSKYVETQMKQIAMQYVSSSSPPASVPSTSSAPPSLFVFHLPSDASETTLRTLFEPYGALASVRVLTGKGYGFVNYESVQSAIAAVNGMNGFRIGNKHLKVEFKKPSTSPPTVVTDAH